MTTATYNRGRYILNETVIKNELFPTCYGLYIIHCVIDGLLHGITSLRYCQ
jgi:hypothetical protein